MLLLPRATLRLRTSSAESDTCPDFQRKCSSDDVVIDELCRKWKAEKAKRLEEEAAAEKAAIAELEEKAAATMGEWNATVRMNMMLTCFSHSHRVLVPCFTINSTPPS